MTELDLIGATPDGGDRALTIIGRAVGVDPTARLVQVALPNAVLWLPAMPGRYRTDPLGASAPGVAAVRVLRDPSTGRPVLVLGPLNPVDPDQSVTMTALNTTTRRATVTYQGSSYVIPYVAATYAAVPTTVWAGLNDWGLPTIVRGPSDVAAAGGGGGGGIAPPSGFVQVTGVAIAPQWSSSWRESRGQWTDEGNVWNSGRYGGSSTLYQGNGFGSGPMKGLATYGDQLVNLGAVSFDRIRVALQPVGLSGASGPASVQPAPYAVKPVGAPVSAGDIASGEGYTDLSADTRERLRTGVAKSLALVGSNYFAVAGAGNGDGMVLIVDYTRPA